MATARILSPCLAREEEARQQLREAVREAKEATNSGLRLAHSNTQGTEAASQALGKMDTAARDIHQVANMGTRYHNQ